MIKLNKGGEQSGQSDQMTTQRFSSCTRWVFTVTDVFARRHWSCLCTVLLCVCTVLLSDSPEADISWFKNVLWFCCSVRDKIELIFLCWTTFRTVAPEVLMHDPHVSDSLFPVCWWPGMIPVTGIVAPVPCSRIRGSLLRRLFALCVVNVLFLLYTVILHQQESFIILWETSGKEFALFFTDKCNAYKRMEL